MDQSVETLIAQVVAERDRYLEALTQVQNRCSELVTENRALKSLNTYIKSKKETLRLMEAHDVRSHVRHFMQLVELGEPPEYDDDGEEVQKDGAPMVPHIPDEATLRLRLKLVAEEFCEMLEACLGKPSAVDLEAWDGWNNLENIRHYIDRAPTCVALPALCDALADLDYVIEGFRLACGVDGGPIAAEVHRSNLTKLPFTKDDSGKVTKGPNFVAPDIEGCLRAQGWEP